jgi:hypothetical protein
MADGGEEGTGRRHGGLIDMNGMSATLYAAIGPADLPRAFVDGTHHSAYGSYALAKCVVRGILEQKLPFG